MTDVFVSYKKSDKDRVRPLVENLRAAGLDVWWDEGIAPSMSWRGEIAKQLQNARCVVAVWTHDSIDHDGGQWVMEEATHGLRRRALAPVRLDIVEPPLGFGEVQYADLAAWSGGAEDPRFQHFLAVVQSIVRAEPMQVGPTPTHFAAPGIKLQNVQMENVRIEVGRADAAGEEEDEDEYAGEDPDWLEGDEFEQWSARRERPSLSPQMVVARVVGILFPLIGVMIFVFTMGGQACRQGNAPAFFCQALDSLRQPAAAAKPPQP